MFQTKAEKIKLKVDAELVAPPEPQLQTADGADISAGNSSLSQKCTNIGQGSSKSPIDAGKPKGWSAKLPQPVGEVLLAAMIIWPLTIVLSFLVVLSVTPYPNELSLFGPLGQGLSTGTLLLLLGLRLTAWPKKIMAAIDAATKSPTTTSPATVSPAASGEKLQWLSIFPPYLYVGLLSLYCGFFPQQVDATNVHTDIHGLARAAVQLAILLQTPAFVFSQYKLFKILSEQFEKLSKASEQPIPLFLSSKVCAVWLLGSASLPLLYLFGLSSGALACIFYFLIQVPIYSFMSSDTRALCAEIGKPKRKARDFLKIVAGHSQDSNEDNNEYFLSYHPFARIERWWKQRMSASSGWKTIFSIAVTIIVGGGMILFPVSLSNLLTTLIASFGTGGAGSAAGAGVGSLDPHGSVAFIHGIELLICLSTAMAAILVTGSAKGLAIGPRGLRFTYSRFALDNKIYWRWSDLTAIELSRPEGKTTTFDDRLILHYKDNLRLIIALGSLPTAEDKEALLAAFDKYAPAVPRSANVTEVLSKNVENSYTELWLQALAAPPKRERLKPMVSGARLQDQKYEIVRELGVGGQGFAYLANDLESGKEIVLKEFVLPVYVDINARKQALDRFEQEARLLTKLEHSQVVKLHGFFVEDHRAYLALEHIDGENLRQIVSRQGALSEDTVRHLAAQMIDILAYLHNLAPPLVHRDFKPDNLILNKDGTLKLIDFNVAQQVESTTTGTVVGKQAYLPPEQFRGQATAKSDIYAMGATLYFLLTGADPVPISTSSPLAGGVQVSGEIDDWIQQLTALDENQRPSAEALKHILSFNEDIPVTAVESLHQRQR